MPRTLLNQYMVAETTGIGPLNQTLVSANTLSVTKSRSMEALVPSYVIIKDILVSADHFIPFNSHKNS